MNTPSWIHPECPDWRRLGPTAPDAAVRALADVADADEFARKDAWSRGFSRRRLLAGGLGVGVASFAQQLVTTRVSYAAEATGTLVVVFLRGAMDGLSVLVPASDPHLASARPGIAVRSGLIRLDDRFGLHPALGALRPLVDAGRVGAVHDVSTPDLSRSHFQAQECLERGGSTSADQRGWLDRALEQSGPGTTFRGMSVTNNLTRSLLGTEGALVARSLDALTVKTDKGMAERTRTALGRLYTGVDHPFATQAQVALDAGAQLASIKESTTVSGSFPDNPFGRDLQMLASLVVGGAAVRVATVDVGGWDMHTQQGTVESGDMKNALTGLGGGLAAFFDALGDKASTTTVVLMTEFGRRVQQNASGGTDHGHGSLALLLGGGVRGGVHGRWGGLAPDALASGDLPGANDFRNVLGEVVMKRMGLSAAEASSVFSGWKVDAPGVMA
ncbi:DUF1501 domain-containing protein [Phycicoccus sp. CSK15P-2]|uniref:DUF1501 domain-containing protein n=1 Tax=Phycicoccus sp. CSK15P-2 TaxID=2807627 RepID=UPI00195276B8|nr:DUF1501 domain-containing protein [Phycicoccus sp. CSK15P-2]MBM6404683.1 DUF1501 domain-containing protein [Phycicoccus sp. CSK15P-2]